MNKQISYYSVQSVSFQYGIKPQVGNDFDMIHAMIYVEGHKPELHNTHIDTSQAVWECRGESHRSNEAKELNYKLFSWERAILSAARRLTGRNQAVTPDGLIAEVSRAHSSLLTLETAFALFLAYKQTQVSLLDITQRLPHQASPQTFASYSKRWLWISHYLKHKRVTSLQLVNIDAPFVQNFYYWKVERKDQYYVMRIWVD